MIRRRSDGRWGAPVALPGGRHKSFYGKTRAEVRQKLVVALKARQEGLPVATSDRLTLGD